MHISSSGSIHSSSSSSHVYEAFGNCRHRTLAYIEFCISPLGFPVAFRYCLLEPVEWMHMPTSARTTFRWTRLEHGSPSTGSRGIVPPYCNLFPRRIGRIDGRLLVLFVLYYSLTSLLVLFFLRLLPAPVPTDRVFLGIRTGPKKRAKSWRQDWSIGCPGPGVIIEPRARPAWCPGDAKCGGMLLLYGTCTCGRSRKEFSGGFKLTYLTSRNKLNRPETEATGAIDN